MKRKEEEAKVARQSRPNNRELGRNAFLVDLEREIVRPMPLLQNRLSERRYSM